MTVTERKPSFALGDWIVEPELHQLTLGDVTTTLEPRVMSVLLELAANPNRVIPKEEFLRTVWPDTFVGEDALTRCISVLRHILKDDPHHPRFIKTVPKVGYCLMVTTRPVEPEPETPHPPLHLQSPLHAAPPEPPASSQVPKAASQQSPAPTPQPYLNPFLQKSIALASLALLVTAALALVWLIAQRRTRAPLPVSIETSLVTVNAGEASRPMLSPEGKRMAFVWAAQDGEQPHIYLKWIGSESQQRLTTLDDEEYSPVWSPDGKSIAFLSSSSLGLALYVASTEGPESLHKLYIPSGKTRWENGALAWSPDGTYFVLADHLGAAPNSSLFRIDIQPLFAHSLTSPPPGWEGDLSPAFSPDGKKIAFLRASENAVMDLYWIDAAGGEPHRVTHDGSMVNGIAWSSDNRFILFSSNRAGEYALWKVSPQGGAPDRLPVGTEEATQPDVSANGKELVFVHQSAFFGILQLNADHPGVHTPANPMLVSSNAQDSAPSVSPRGDAFAFQSWRSGSQQIWISSIDGRDLRRLTPAGGPLSGSGSPAWSPLGNDLAFDSRLAGHSHIFVIPAAGGTPRQVTFGEDNDIVPRWSNDGRSLYFRSNRGGRWQLWKLSGTGAPPQPVTRDDGMAGQESPDGQWLYFTRGGENGIWRMPLSGGEETRVLDQPAAGYWAYWTVTPDGLYFLDTRHPEPQISVFDPGRGTSHVFAKLNRMPPLYSGLSLLPDQRSLLLSDMHDAGTHISLAHGKF